MIAIRLLFLLCLSFVPLALGGETHAALGAAVETSVPASPRYPGKAGAATLVDGMVAETSYGGGVILGFEGIDVEITVRLDEPIQVHAIAADFLQITAPAIYLPTSVDFAVSENGTNFRTVATVAPKATEQDAGPLHERFQVIGLDLKAQAVRVRVGNGGKVPPDHRAPQALRWTFVSEVLVNPGDKPVSVWDAMRRYRFGASRICLARVEGLLRGTVGEERQAALGALRDVLADGEATVDARLFACEMLGLHGDLAAVPALARALEVPELFEASAQALAALGLPEAERALLAALPTAVAKAPLVAGLASFRTPAAAQAVAPFLADGELGPLAARSLAAIGGETAVRALAAAEDMAGRPWLGEALVGAADADALPAPARVAALRQAMAQGTPSVQLAAAGVLLRRDDDPAALARVLRDAASASATLRAQATGLLGERVEKRGLAALGEGFAALPSVVRGLLVGREREQAPLLALLGDADPEIRLSCSQRLGECGDGEAVPALVSRLVGTDAERQAATEALAGLRGEDVDAALRQAGAASAPAVRPALAEIFRRRGTPDADATVLAWIRDGSLPSAEGWRVLAELAGSGLLVPLADELAARSADRPAIGKALLAAARRAAGAETGADLAARFARAADPTLREPLVQALGALGNREALRLALADPHLDVRLAAIRALGECGEGQDVDALLPAAEADDPRQNVLALRAALQILDRAPAEGADLAVRLERATRSARRDEERTLVDAAWVHAAENAWTDFPGLAAEQLARVADATADEKLRARARGVLARIDAFRPFLAKLADRPWQAAFNGRDLAGWRPVNGKPDSWTARDGLLVANAGGGGWLARSEEMADYVFELEFRLPPGGNSGFFLRPPLEGNPAWEGIEIQLLDDAAPQYAGKLRPDQYCASVYGMGPAEPGLARPAGEWQRLRVLCAGRRVAVWLNGRPASAANLDEHMDKAEKIRGLTRAAGYPGLQNEHGPIEFRNLRFRDLR